MNSFRDVCAQGNLKEVQRIFNIQNIDNYDLSNALYESSINGHLEIVKWLYSKNDRAIIVDSRTNRQVNPNGFDRSDIYRWFSSSSAYGQLKIVQWLYSQGVINLRDVGNNAFVGSCQNGHLETSKWLCSQGANIHAWDDWAFVLSCRYNNLETAKWLYSQGANIHEWDDLAFCWSCQHGCLKTSQWLYSQGANIYSENDLAFFVSCLNGHLNIAKWLVSLDPTRYQLSESGQPIILRNFGFSQTRHPVECIVCTIDKICYQLPCCPYEICGECFQQLESFRCPNCRRFF